MQEIGTPTCGNHDTEKSGSFEGFDHRIGHFRPLRIIGTTPNSSALNGLGASTWDRSRWGGRRHDQGRFERLGHLQNQTGGSRIDVVRLGQTLLEFVVDKVKPGEPFKLKAKDGTWHTIYLPIPKH
jgi:hypothetical protein